jgi:lipoprotein-releasing system permease protein
MPFELFLALRYLNSQKRRKLARITTLAAIVGVAFGVGTLIVALSLANGFRDEMRDKILKGTAHVTIMRRDGQPIDNWRAVAAQTQEVPGVVSAYPTTYDGALLGGPSGSAFGVLRGVDSGSKGLVESIRKTLTEGSAESIETAHRVETTPGIADVPGDSPTKTQKNERIVPNIEAFKAIPSEAAIPTVIVGSELANRTGLEVGAIATLVSTEATLTPLGIAPRYRSIRVGGVFRSGLYEYDSTWIYLPLGQASEFAGRIPGAASFLSVETSDIYRASKTATDIREKLGAQYTTVDWQDANRPLFSALALERRMGLFIIGLIILIAVLNITSTLVLVVVERRTDIAILSAMGARRRSITAVFVLEGAAVGLIGAVSGVVLGLVGCVLGNYYKIVSLPADVYSVGSVPFHPHLQDVIAAAGIAFALSLIATIYPAMAAARGKPAEALRT